MKTSGINGNILSTEPEKRVERPSAKALLERSIKEIKTLKQKLKKHELREHGPIAIIGMGCRYPGGIVDADSFWQCLKEGKDGISQLSNERWDMDAFYDPDPQKPGKIYSKAAGIIDKPEYFDSEFFGISPREAETMDPQHRLLLETVYESMEDAGYASKALSGTRTGVFIGIASSDYAHLGSRLGEPEQIQPWNGTGNAFSAAAGRISYLYNLKGPSIAVDTACSSSLVALHYACQSLRREESDCAFVGGVSLLLNPGASIIFSRAGMLSKSGACRTFSDDADGYVRSEGAGVVMIKRLADAERAGDNIIAVIRGSAVNQDGKSQGLTAPNETAQVEVIKAALADAQMNPGDIGYVEAHGTGTPLGDPIEIAALQNVYCDNQGNDPGNKQDNQRRNNPLVVGTVKTNLGHTEAASGIAGLIKLALSLKKAQIPPHLHFNTPSAHIGWREGSLSIPTELIDWPPSASLQAQPDTRKGGLSSFGFAGTNAHIIVESYPYPATPVQTLTDHRSNTQLVALSAKTPKALVELVDRYQRLIETNAKPTDTQSLSYSTLVGRDHHKYRLAFTTSSDQQWRDRIGAYHLAEGGHHYRGKKTKSALKIAFLFPGQGSQYSGMGAGLYERFSGFRDIIDHCDDQLQALCSISLKNLMWGTDSSELVNTRYTQVALFCLEYSLAKFWISLGVKPTVLVGHSLGEYVAACVAGVFSLKDGLKLVNARGLLMQELTQPGSMMVVSSDSDTIATYISDSPSIAIAAINGEDNLVLAGEQQEIKDLMTLFKGIGIRSQLLNVSHAFHSTLLEPMVDAFKKVLAEVQFAPPRLSLYSNKDGKRATQITNPSYWIGQLLNTVRFDQCCHSIIENNCDIAIEVGPGSALLSLVAGHATSVKKAKRILPVISLKQNQAEEKVFLDSLAKTYTSGQEIQWKNLFDKQVQQRIHLPNYPFQRKVRWSDAISLPKQKQSFLQEAADWLYTINWKSISVEPAQRKDNEHWLIFTDGLDVGFELTHLMESQGLCVTTTCINELNDADGEPDLAKYHLLLATIGLENAGSDNAREVSTKPLNIVFLSSIDFNEKTINRKSGVTEQYHRFCQATDLITDSILYLVQAMQRRKNCSLWLITDGAVCTDSMRGTDNENYGSEYNKGDNEIALNSPQFIVAGFAKTLKLELAGSFKSHIDIRVTDHLNHNILFGILQSNTTETAIAVRHDVLLVPRLERTSQLIENATLVDNDTPEKSNHQPLGGIPVQQNASYLIIGGLGSIGFSIAEHLITLGARKLVLVSRGGIESIKDPRVVSQLTTYIKSGLDIQCHQIDITDQEQLFDLLKGLNSSDNPIKGVVHAAGSFDITPLKDLTPASCRKVMNSKVKGMWLLDRLVENHCNDLDFFVGFSSIASVWGSAGNFHYAGANAYVDGMMHKRRKEGKPAKSINWGPWSNTHMVSEDSSALAMKRGLSMLSHSQGVRLFDWAVNQPELNQLVIAKISWPTLRPLLELTGGDLIINDIQVSSSTPSLSRFGPPSSDGLSSNDDLLTEESDDPETFNAETETSNIETLSQADIEFKNKLAHWTKEERESQLLSYLRYQLIKALQIDDSDLDSTSPLINIGIDSLIAVEFRNRIRLLTDIDVPVVKLLEGANLLDIAELLSDHYESSINASTELDNLEPNDAEESGPTVIEGAL